MDVAALRQAAKFLSTPPAGGPPWVSPAAAHRTIIPIPPPGEEGDAFTPATRLPNEVFLSTPSARRATRKAPGPRP